MSDIAIRVEDLSKQYRLGVVGTGTLSHDLNRWWYKVRGKEDPYLKIGEENDRSTKGSSQYVWALKDINFEVKQGEILGIIGKNGAGKSTLLKLLSRVTSPTTGAIKTKGRIASLLEVGTGFHEELTGRENIFLNGAILGMSKAEIRSKLDEIIAFSGTERYIDTPVKRYSSGMRVRLAFAVAAHLEPEILIVDEVLAVGDAEFQKKAIGKMQEVSGGGGRTVLFVSHNMGAVKSLCNRGIYLKNGSVAFDSNNISEVANKYFQIDQSVSGFIPISERRDRQGNGNVKIQSISILNSVDDFSLELGRQVGFTIKYNGLLDSFVGKILVSINSSNGECILFMDSTTIKDFPSKFKEKGEIHIKLSKEFALPVGQYHINIAFFSNGTMADYIQNALVLEVVDGLFYEGGKIPIGKSLCYVQQEWNYQIL